MKYWITDTKDPEGIPESVEAHSFGDAVSIFAKASEKRKDPPWHKISVRELSGKSTKNGEIREYRLNNDDDYVDEPEVSKTKRPKIAKPSDDITFLDRCELFIEEFETDLTKMFETTRGIHGQLVVKNNAVCVSVRIKDMIYADVDKTLFRPLEGFTQQDLESLLANLGLLDNESNRTKIRERLNKCGATNLSFTAWRLKVQRTLYILVNAETADEAENLAAHVIAMGDFHPPINEVPWAHVETERLTEACQPTNKILKVGEFTLHMLTNPEDDE